MANPPSLPDVIEATEQLLRTALRAGRPHGVQWEVTELYRAADASRHKTEALLAACLSDWHSFVRDLENAGDEPLSLDQVTTLLVHRAYNRHRRKEYRDKQMAKQVEHAHVRGRDGEQLPFDPPARSSDEALKNLSEEIAFLMAERSLRDRLIIELRYFGGFAPAEIIPRVRAACPEASISAATISRVLQKFEDELRPRLEPAD